MKYKILTKKFLEREYIGNKNSLIQIVDKVGCNDEIIRYYLIKYNIPRRSRAEAIGLKYKLIFSKRFLWEEYINKHKSINKISKEIGCLGIIVSKYLKLNKIPKRTHSEATMGYGKKEVRVIDKIYYCKDCGKKIHWETALYGGGKCGKCAGIKRRNKEKYVDHYCKEKNCNNKISYNAWKNGGGRCLSCAGKEAMKDPTKHYNWQGGISFEPYPLGWNKTFKEQIRYRDGYRCQICGVPEVECSRKLHVHHIDYDKENLNESNLTSLCNSCHMKTNFNRNDWIKYFTKKINGGKINVK